MDVHGVAVSVEIGAILTALVALVGGFVGLSQYRASERWKRAEFTIAQVKMLSDDATLAFCCRAIDWGVGPLIIPAKYCVLFPEKQTTIEHDWSLMAKALRPKLHEDWRNSETRAQFLLYRYAFDDFFSYLDALAMYRRLRVVRKHDLHPLMYYLVQLKNPHYWNREIATIEPDQVFGDFLKAFYEERVWAWVDSSC